MASEKVREFCKKLTKELKSGHWGDMEPEIFENIAEGREKTSDIDGLLYNKIDEDEMEMAVREMEKILERIL